MAVLYGTVRKYDTPEFLLKSMVRLYGMRFVWRYEYGTLVRCLNVRIKRTNVLYHART